MPGLIDFYADSTAAPPPAIQAMINSYNSTSRRALSPAARRAEDEKIGKGKKPEKAKWKFLQKYHHKGAFFMDDDTLAKAGEGDVRNRATDGAVLEDKFDRAALPKVMQVKDFGFQGRTKYTHLSDQTRLLLIGTTR